MADAPTVVFVPGNFTGPWSWDKVAPVLADRGVPSLAVDRRTEDGTRVSGDFELNQRVVHEALDSLTGPAILVGHSAGSTIITYAGMHPRVVHLVYLAGATLPGSGLPIAATQEWRGGFEELPDGSHRASAEHAIKYAMNDWSREDIDRALPQMLPNTGMGPRPDIEGEPAWKVKPSTTVVCANDLTVDQALIRQFAALTSEYVEWPTGHIPHISQPQLVVDLLAGIADRFRE